MRVAVDADCLAVECGVERSMIEYVGWLSRALAPAVERVLVLTRAENHARLETLRDDRTDVVLVRRPLFEGREVADWAALFWSHPRVGGELLAAHLQEKLRVIGQLGAQALHFPTDAGELMEIDLPIVLSVHGEPAPSCRLSMDLADALVVHDAGGAGVLRAAKTFLVPMGSIVSTPAADNDPMRLCAGAACAAVTLAEAYEHALASFELRKVA
jgi:hypothetical protein